MFTYEQLEQLLGPTWAQYLQREFYEYEYMQDVIFNVKSDKIKFQIYPDNFLKVFRAYRECPLDKNLRVVIIGQDPYINGEADGLAFSARDAVKVPPSLENLMKLMELDLGFPAGLRGPDLTGIAKQGVLLLNTVLTVRAGQSGSHFAFGWQTFTGASIDLLWKKKNVVFILFGKRAQSFAEEHVNILDHCIIKAPHPSPYSADSEFFNSKVFSRCNKLLEETGQDPIDWSK